MSNNNLVLVTRPKHQAVELVDLLTTKGFKSLVFPSIEIQQVELSDDLKVILNKLNENNLIVFVSVNAAQNTAKLMHRLGLKPDSITAKIATVGKATASAATALGFKVNLSPESGFNSEALLKLEELQAANIQGAQCLILRGNGGLGYLADELRKRGAQVRYAEVYRRTIPQKDEYISRQELSNNWDEMKINVITVTSNESLQNLYDMLKPPGKNAILETALIVASQRGVELAQSLGFKSITLAQSALNQHILEAVEINVNK
ncbi:MAG: uroporphyrinogen-III synthase [Gammaproteobacteria bacterium]|nr:uroporphyrinogen-III synthase [Gammaproteobacteria bacterium]